MKINTSIFQKMVSKVIQGASANKMIPLSSLIGIEFKEDVLGEKGSLILTTTDGSNQFKVNHEVEGTGEFYTIVNADTFSKLVGKTTKEFIELENKENYLEVKGNGTYKLEITINEEGEMVKFPDIITLANGVESLLNLEILKEQIKVAKASVAKTMEVPCLTGYYIGNNTITTDRQLVCSIENLEMKQPLLISSEMAELLLLVDGSELITLYSQDNNLIFTNANFTIYGKELEGKENYPVKSIENLLDTKYDNEVKVNKNDLLSVLDRLNLFVSDYDKNGVFLDFKLEGLVVKSQKSNAEELVEIENTIEKEFTCLVDIQMLIEQIKTISTETVDIWYGQDKSIKIVDDKVTHIISLLEKAN